MLLPTRRISGQHDQLSEEIHSRLVIPYSICIFKLLDICMGSVRNSNTSQIWYCSWLESSFKHGSVRRLSPSPGLAYFNFCHTIKETINNIE